MRVCRDALTGQSLGYGYVNYDASLDPDAGAFYLVSPIPRIMVILASFCDTDNKRDDCGGDIADPENLANRLAWYRLA